MNNVTAGFLVVKTYTRLHREYCEDRQLRNVPLQEKGIYSVPRVGIDAEQIKKKYSGISRDPIQPWTEKLLSPEFTEPAPNERNASLFMDELEKQRKADDDFIFLLDDTRKLFRMIDAPIEREVIWAARTDSEYCAPKETILLGYEPTAFYPGEHFSVLADCLFFPTFHGHDEEGTLFISFHEKLNKWGLFDTLEDARAFTELYLAQDWSEYMEYLFAEIRLVNQGKL